MIIFPFGTSSITSLRMYTKELYVLEKNNHISEIVWVTKVYLTFSQISKSQVFRATLKLNFICLFLWLIAPQKITLHIDTHCTLWVTLQFFLYRRYNDKSNANLDLDDFLVKAYAKQIKELNSSTGRSSLTY